MEYPGNSSLSPDVRERVLNTYQQTLGLATQGNRQEASLGCDFILRLDPEFEPARTLMSRLERGDGPVQVEDLRPGGPAFLPTTAAEDPFGELEHVDLELPSEQGADAGAGGLEGELQQLFRQRLFSEVLRRAEQHGAGSDPRIEELVAAARSRVEAEPYLQSFLDSARAELRAGNQDQAARLLESARELDASHPAIRELSGLLGHQPAAPTASPGAGASFDSGLDLGLDSEPGSGGFSLGSAGSPGAPSGDDGRIRDLLGEGQSSFDQGDYQGAIDAWSRIFLIDIDHQEAARRIEKARRLKAEHERQIEEVFHEGVSAFEAGETDEAARQLRKVLELQPNHLAAKEYLQKIEAGEAPQPEASPPPGAPATPAPPSGAVPARTRIPDLPPPTEGEALGDEILIPPEPGERRARPPVSGQTDGRRPQRTFLVLGALVLAAVLAGSWLVYQQWDDWFPNANDPATSGPAQDPIRSATAFHDLGKTDFAIAQLKRLAPNDPHYEAAQALILQWEAEVGQRAAANEPAGTDGAAPEDGEGEIVDPQQKSLQDDLLARARRAAQSGRYLQAENLVLEAEQVADLDAEGQALLAQVRESLEPIRRQIELVRGGDWEFALPDLWRMREQTPSDPNITELLIASYYNLGVRDLQRGDATSAVGQFEEAIDLLAGAPDPELERDLRFARAYQGRSKDLLYQIYVKYLPIRR